MLTEREATEQANELLAQMNGQHWRTRTWCHVVGWHYCVESGPLTVYPSSNYSEYYCLVGRNGCGEQVWSDAITPYFKDPNIAVYNALSRAQQSVVALQSIIEQGLSVMIPDWRFASIRSEVADLSYINGPNRI